MREIELQKLRLLREQEKLSPRGWWLLSFEDGTGPRGSAIVEAHGPLTGLARVTALGIYPGGGVRAVPLRGPPAAGCADRLLTPEEFTWPLETG